MTSPSYEGLGSFYLGRQFDLPNRELQPDKVLYDSKDLTTHAVCVGMTGSGKTGLCLSLIEEAAIDGVPVIAIDPKGDLGNLLLTFPGLQPSEFRPWIDEDEAVRKGATPDEYAKQTAQMWSRGLADWEQDGSRIQKFKDAVDIGIYTPGSNAGLPLSIIRSFKAPNATIVNDSDAFRERVASAVGGLLTLLGIDTDPIRSRDYILVSNIVSHAWQQGQDLSLAMLIQSIQQPPFDKIGFMSLETIYPQADRFELSMQINNLLASPGFQSWMQGEALDVERLLSTPQGKPRISIMSISHLSEKERMFFVTILLNEILTWTRSQPGTSSLRAILYMDEVFGYFPPTANPPSKQPMLTLLKQARAYGLGIVLATQNPVDLDYKGLSNTGTWFIGRLQTERDKLRVLDGLEGASTTAGSEFDRATIDSTLSAVGKRVFLMHNVHDSEPTVFHTRWALSYLRGPLTRQQITTLMADRKATAGEKAIGDRTNSPSAPNVFTTPTPATTGTAPATTESAGLTAGATEASNEPQRPMVPASISQRFFSCVQPIPTGSRLVYRPVVFGYGKLRYADAKSKIDIWQDFSLITDASHDIPSDLWDSADKLTEQAEFDSNADESAVFADLSADCLLSKNFTKWKTELKNYLYRDHMLPLWFSASPKLYSKPDETEAGFRMRIKQALREDRDLAIEKLRKKFASKLQTMKDRIRRAEERVEREKSQMNQQGLYTAISFGSSILGAMFGKKVASVTNVGKAATTMRSASRVARERGDVSRAQEGLEDQQEKLAQMEEEFEQQIEELEAPVRTEELPIEEYPVRPRKTDITISEVALGWLPFSVDSTGIATPLFRAEE